MILLHTDHLSVLTDGRHVAHPRLVARLSAVREPVVIPVIAVEEQLRAWLTQLHRVRDVAVDTVFAELQHAPGSS